ncbi:unnamed protein product [Heterobilharzia americana]|nr:unnamed protein product [Heterobilharzia americana]
MASIFYGLAAFCLLFITINRQMIESSGVILPYNYKWASIPYIDEDGEVSFRRVLVPTSSTSSSSSSSTVHKRGPELIIPFISGGSPAKKSDELD